jgi:hypothetical protein
MNELNKVNSIYKVNHLIENNKIDKIIVFYGKNENINIKSLNELFKKEPNNTIFTDKNTKLSIFNNEELENIKNNNIDVIFSEEQIHFDDSIGSIKLKIFNEMKETFSIEEIYLFSIKKIILNTNKIYKSLLQINYSQDFLNKNKNKNKILLTKHKLEQLIFNITRDENDNPIKINIPDKELYDFNDILSLNLNEKQFWVNITLGKSDLLTDLEYPYIINPFDLTNENELMINNIPNSLITINSNILLDSGKIVDNNIYLCLAKNVLKNKLKQDDIIKLYYPFLYIKNIHSLDDLNENEEKLKSENRKLWNENTSHYFKSIDLFFDIYKFKKNNLNYKISGVKFIKVIIKPYYQVKIPLEIIFKIIHANENNPLIKYNPSSRQENIYRLYTEKIATDGRKIPFLSKATIFKLMKTIGKKIRKILFFSVLFLALFKAASKLTIIGIFLFFFL